MSPPRGRRAARGRSCRAPRRSTGRRRATATRRAPRGRWRRARAEEHRLQARDERVPAEHGHEPGSRRRAAGRGCRGRATERGEVGDGLGEAAPERRLEARAGAGCAGATLERLAHVGALGAEPCLADAAARRSRPREGDAEPRIQALARSERHSEAQAIRSRLGPRLTSTCADGHLEGLREQELCAARLQLALRRSRQWRRVQRVTEGEVVLLDGDHVRAKSAAKVSVSSNEASCMLTLRTRTTSVRPGPTNRHGRSRSCPARGSGPAGCAGRMQPRSTRPARTRAAAVAHRRRAARTARGSACRPRTAPPATRSPISSQIQNVEPSRIVRDTSREATRAAAH